MIESEEEYQRALQIVEPLQFKEERTPEERKLYKLLVLLVEAYEQKHYSLPETSPHRRLLHFLEYSSVTQADLVGVIADEKEVAAIVKGEKTLSREQAEKLADQFNVSAEIFV